MLLSPTHIIRSWWAVAALVAILTVAACGGPSDQNRDEVGESPQGSSGSNIGQQEETTGSGPFTAANPCDAFSMLGGAGGPGFMAQVLGGPSIETSESPPSDFAAELGQFTKEALEDVFDGDVSVDCFVEASTGDGGGVWIALTLPEAPPSGAAESVGDAMEAMGATVAGAVSANSAGGTFGLVSLETLPLNPPSGDISMGSLYFVTSPEGYYQAVMLASYEDNSGGNGQVTSSVGADPSSGSGMDIRSIPTTGPTTIAVTPTGMAATINDKIQPALEDILSVSLAVESFVQISAGGTDTVSLFYGVDDGLLDDTDVVAGFTEIVEGLDGTVTFSMVAGGGVNVTFEGLAIEELTMSGTLGISGGKIFVIISNISGS